MRKTLIAGLVVGVAFSHSGFSQAQSITVPFSPTQEAAFCAANGTGGLTNIDLRLPTGAHLIAVVDCSPPALTSASSSGEGVPDLAAHVGGR
ncbi:hypothetical protein [Devosia sp. A449]